MAPDSVEARSSHHVNIMCTCFAAAGAEHALKHAEVNLSGAVDSAGLQYTLCNGEKLLQVQPHHVGQLKGKGVEVRAVLCV